MYFMRYPKGVHRVKYHRVFPDKRNGVGCRIFRSTEPIYGVIGIGWWVGRGGGTGVSNRVPSQLFQYRFQQSF